MEKLSAVRAERDEGDDVHFFAAILERALERAAVGSRDEQLVLGAASAGMLGEASEEALDGAGLIALGEEIVQLVVQRTDSLGDRHVLRDSRQVAAMLFGQIEGLGQPAREALPVFRGGTRAEDVNEPAREQRADHLPESVLAGAW